MIALLDVKGIVCSAYHGTSSSNPYTGAIGVFRELIDNIKRKYNPNYIIGAWEQGRTHRHDLYEHYKAGRPEKPVFLKVQLEQARDLLVEKSMIVWARGYEADDVIATCCRKSFERGTSVVIVSRDKDLLQLVDEDSVSMDRSKGKTWWAKDVREEYGVDPWLLKDVFALAGDSIDNIPGVRGIGAKKASELVSAYGGIDSIYANIDHVGMSFGRRTRSLLVDGEASARLSLSLTTLLTDLELSHGDPKEEVSDAG